jgi:hypothetical protein
LWRLHRGVRWHDTAHHAPYWQQRRLVDEADRLKMLGLEQLQDIYDRSEIGLILIGMPGIEKRLSRYPQLYSRVGFVHQFRPLSAEEVQSILEQKWQQLGYTLHIDDLTDMEAVAAIVRITDGNFCLLHRLFAQIERIIQINKLQTVSNTKSGCILRV